jgi:tetratricopeptide (TPR) repeat protein
VGADGGQAGTVARRVSALTEGREEAGRRLVSALGASGEPARRRAGASIALDLGLETEALALSREVAGDLGGRSRGSFLADVARRARDGGLSELAAWAYGELGDDAGSPGERRQFDQRLVEASLAAGDTAAALEAQRRVAESFTPGSVDRRRATAQVIRLEAAGSDPDRLRGLLAEFREAFPRAPELDDLGATVAAGLLARDDAVAAAAVLEGIDGPRSNLERGYLLMDAGDVALGRQALLMAVPGLLPSDATEIIQFAGLLGRLSPPGVALLADAGVLAHRGRVEEAARAVAEGADALPEEERPPLLAEAARMAERGGAGEAAAELRRSLLTTFPEAPEVAEAALALARWEAEREGGRDEAIRLLERLIVERPTAAVVPAARRELEKLRGRGS